MIFWVSFGSSPTQIMAVLSFLSFRCLSIQLAEAFNVPSSNHLIFTSSLLYFTSLIFLKGFIHEILFPSFFQNAFLFLIDSLYLFWYCALFANEFFIHSGLVLKISSFDDVSFISFLLNLVLDLLLIFLTDFFFFFFPRIFLFF